MEDWRMNILILKSNGGKFAETCVPQLRDMGHSVELWGRGYNLENFGWHMKNCDVIVDTVDHGRSWIRNYSGSKALKVFWSMDTHICREAHIKAIKQNRCSVAISSVLRGFGNESLGRCNRYFLPNAFPEHLYHKTDDNAMDRPILIAFLGHAANRGDKLKKLSKKYPDFQWLQGYYGDNMVDKMQEIAIHWNANISHDINCRTFEAAASGSLVVTDNGEPEVFTCDEVITYIDFEHCLERLWYYMNNRYEANKIAVAGRERAWKDHTWKRRAEQFIEIINKHI